MTKTPGKSSRPHRAEREFGLLVGGILALLGAWWTYRGRFGNVATLFLALGGLLVALGASKPAWLELPRRLWMRLAEGIGGVMTIVILSLVFFLVVTPIGLWKRAFGWDPLGRRAARQESHWRTYSPRLGDPRHFEKMF